jgi:hypothetical protein
MAALFVLMVGAFFLLVGFFLLLFASFIASAICAIRAHRKLTGMVENPETRDCVLNQQIGYQETDTVTGLINTVDDPIHNSVMAGVAPSPGRLRV